MDPADTTGVPLTRDPAFERWLDTPLRYLAWLSAAAAAILGAWVAATPWGRDPLVDRLLVAALVTAASAPLTRAVYWIVRVRQILG